MSTISQLHIHIQTTPLATVFRTALREVRELREMVVEIETDDGLRGRGAACPTPQITGEGAAGMREVVGERIFPAIRGESVLCPELLSERIATATVGNSSAKAAVEMAVYGLWAQALGRPLYQLLGGYRTAIDTDCTLSLDAPQEMAKEAVAAVERGFRVLKVKVGGPGGLDGKRVAAIRRAVGEEVALRLDANQSWRPKEAVRWIRQLQQYNPEFVEQPVAAPDIDGLRWVTERVEVPVVADESVFSAADAMRVLASGAADMVNIKLLKCGGIREALAIVAVAESLGAECMLGCMLEGPVSLAASIHLALAKKSITRFDLDSLFFVDRSQAPEIEGIDYGPCIRRVL